MTVVGHSDLGGTGLNGEVAVLGNYAFVGMGVNGGFAAQWARTPKCNATTKVKVVNLTDPAKPAVTSTIDLTIPGEDPGATIGRSLAAIKVKSLSPANSAFTGDLLAVALESCGGNGRLGVNFYDVTNPASPVLLGTDTPGVGTATRDVSLVQRPDGRVLALAANQSGSIRALDVTAPSTPVPMGNASATGAQGCRPFSFAQGVSTNAAGSRAYAAFGDGGLFTADLSSLAPGSTLPKLSSVTYPSTDEGNSLRYVPNADETAALATDDDPMPAKTTISINGPAGTPLDFAACEAVWGKPLHRQASPSLSRPIVAVANGGCDADYAGKDVTGKIVLLDRTGSGDCFSFDGKARIATQKGAAAVIVANTSSGAVFAPDAVAAGDAGATIPFALTSQAAGSAIKERLAANPNLTATLTDTPDTWGALRIFDLPSPTAAPTQAAVFKAPHTRTFEPGDGFYQAVEPIWDGNRALVAWMSDGLRVVDLTNRSTPTAGPFYVPPAVADPTGNFGTVPLVVGVAKLGNRVVISDINSGLYVLGVGAAPEPTPTATPVPTVTPVPSPTVSPSPTAGAKPFEVKRLKVRLKVRIRPKHDRTLPYRFKAIGRVVLPHGTSKRKRRRFCGAGGKVSIQTKNGRKTVSTRRSKLHRSCKAKVRLRFAIPMRLGRHSPYRLKMTGRFTGNKRLKPDKARPVRVKAG